MASPQTGLQLNTRKPKLHGATTINGATGEQLTYSNTAEVKVPDYNTAMTSKFDLAVAAKPELPGSVNLQAEKSTGYNVDMGKAAASAGAGAVTGAMAGGVVGAAVGAVVSIASTVIGGFMDQAKARKENEKIKKENAAALVKYNNEYATMKQNTASNIYSSLGKLNSYSSNGAMRSAKSGGKLLYN